MIIVLIAVFVLGTILSAGPSSSTSAQAADPPTPTAAPSNDGLHPISPSSPLYGPKIDPRRLHDRQHRQAGLASAPQAKPLPPGMLDRLRQQTSVGTAKPSRVAGASLAQTASSCTQWILNPGLTDTNGNGRLEKTDQDPSGTDANWYTDIPTATIDTITYTSGPNAVRLQDGDETVDATDIDMISQDMAFKSTDTDLSLQFQLYQTTNDPGYDSLYYGLATFITSTSKLDTFLYWNVVPDQTPGTWNTIYDRIDDPAIIQSLKDADQIGTGVWLVFFNITDGLAPFVNSIIDDVYATTCESTGVISGTVNKAGTPTIADLLLVYNNTATGTFEVVNSTRSLSDGSYSFSGLRPLVGDGSDHYQVYYSNDGSDGTQVSMWVGPATTTVSNGGITTLSSFDLSDLVLSSPADDAKTTLPATISWASRGLSGEGYYYCIYDTDTFVEGCSNRLSSPSFELTLAKLQSITGLNFQYDHRYAWYVIVEAADGAISQGINYGFSYYERGVTATEVAPPTPPTPPPPSGQAPSGGSGQDWTVMAYIAGDNNLGDLIRYPNPAANLQGQFAILKQLAASYPKVNIVTLTDFYDGSGTQLCQLKPDNTQNCQQLGEKDTSDPTVLTTFINSAMDRFPANHTMLIIADHGHALGGVASDETTAPTAVMDPGEISQAFQNSRLATKKADIIFYSACLMGSFESAYNAATFANYVVASSDELWVLSVYERMLPLLSGTSKNDPRAVAIGMVDAYKRSVQATNGTSLFISSAAYDLSKVTLVNNAISQLGLAITDGLNSTQSDLVRSTLNRVRNNVQVYDSSGNNLLDPSEDALVDLRHLATLLSGVPNSGNGGTVAELSAIKSAAADVLSTLGPVGDTANSFVIASQQISGGNGGGGTHDLSNASGLAIFMPNGNAVFLNKGQQRAMSNSYLNGTIFTAFNSVTQWDEGLRRYTGMDNGSAPTGGPGRFVRGTLPIDGALPDSALTYTHLPMIRR